MKKSCWAILVPGFCLCLLWIIAGCDIQVGNWAQARYERTIQRQVPLAAGSTLVAKTSFGSVTIAGADVTDCSVVAEICGRAPTEQEARELAEQVTIELETEGSTLTVKAEKPVLKKNRSISISYDITVPSQTNIECASSYGAIKLTGINGNVNGETISGSIIAENIEGSADLDTSYGSVKCNNITGDNIIVKSSSGSITAEDIRGSVRLNTSYGSITCKEISGGDIELGTSSGGIKLSNASFGDCEAHTSYGSISSEQLKGNLLRLHSGSGSIDVAEASAKTSDLSTSYGRITCWQIIATDLGAKSGSGNIDIAYSDSAPSEITADAVTSYGSIDFVTPPNFSGRIELSTSYGSLKTDLPITTTGEVSNKKLTGKIGIGDGRGKLHLQTSSGSIRVR